MAHNESATTMMVPEKLNPKVMASPAPKTASKRSATSEGQWPECSSTPTSSRKKAFLEPGGGTPLSVVSLNASALDRSGSSSSRSRNQRSSTLRITRGIQTIAPETVNRYCTARISRRTASVPVQTDSVYVLSSPPKKILRADATCQTAEPAVQEACVGTSQQVELPSKQSVDSGCQTMALEDQSITVHTTSTPKHSSTEQLKNDNEESSPSSIGTLLNGLERVFGFDVSSNEKQPDDSKEATKGIEKQTACDQQQHLLQESFVNETSKTVATKLDKKMSIILERHLATYNRSMAYNRMQFMQWMKNFHTRQRQLEAKATRSQMARRVIVVRKRAPPVVVPRPAVTEQSIQCDLPIVLPPEPPKTAVTVGTQWTRQKQTIFSLRLVKPPPTRPQPPPAKDRCDKPNCTATLKEEKIVPSGNQHHRGDSSNKENVPPNCQ